MLKHHTELGMKCGAVSFGSQSQSIFLYLNLDQTRLDPKGITTTQYVTAMDGLY